MGTLRVGVVGVGAIGSVAVRGLLAAGHDVEVAGRSRAPVQAQVELGAVAASSLDSMARHCDVVVVAVLDEAQVRSVVRPLASAGAPVVVVHSTVSPQAMAELADEAAPGTVLVDAPVSDNRGADLHRLMGFIGVRGLALPPTATDVLDCYCHGYQVVGDVGAGQVMKLACNVMSMVNGAAVREALALCEAYGIDAGTATALGMRGSASSWILENWSRISPRREIVVKDLSTAQALGQRAGLAMPVTAAARDAAERIT